MVSYCVMLRMTLKDSHANSGNRLTKKILATIFNDANNDNNNNDNHNI